VDVLGNSGLLGDSASVGNAGGELNGHGIVEE
jgi:hypothetical protein